MEVRDTMWTLNVVCLRKFANSQKKSSYFWTLYKNAPCGAYWFWYTKNAQGNVGRRFVRTSI